MIRISKFRFLYFNNKKYKCCLGKKGLTKNKVEGDNKTPIGIYRPIKCYYRPDRLHKPITKLFCLKIKKNMGWCNDKNSKYYNRAIKLPKKRISHEKLFRNDNLYDIFVVIDYNTKKIIKNKGSAIFLHICSENYRQTQGCVSVSKKHLLEILKKITKKTKIKIG